MALITDESQLNSSNLILGIDGSGLVASVALVRGMELLGEYTTNFKKTHSQTLLPMLAELTDMTGVELADITAIAVAAGPGSFTGLRIASSTAKGLGFSLEKPIISVPTVDALAFNMWGASDLVCPIMDARRGQVYTGLYDFSDGKMNTIMAQDAMAFLDIAARINELGRPVVFLGDGVPVFIDDIKNLLTVPVTLAPAGHNRQRASCVAALGSMLYADGQFTSAADHRPDYLRLSQAERERQEQLEKEGKSC